MKNNQILEQCRSRLVKEGILKSAIIGLAIGCAADFAIAAVLWFTYFQIWWVSIIAGVAIAVGCTLMFYYFKYRPTPKMLMERLDRLGFDERFITMMEYQKDDSYIAKRQREDALNAMSEANKVKPLGSRISLTVSKAALVVAAVAIVACIPMTTATALAANGSVGGGQEVIGGIINPVTLADYTVTYSVVLADDDTRIILKGGDSGTADYGFIDGKFGEDGKYVKTVKEGGSADAVVANAYVPYPIEVLMQGENSMEPQYVTSTEDGEEVVYYMFIGWSNDSDSLNDLETDPEKTVENVTSDVTVYAVFIAIPYDEFPGVPFGGSGNGNGDGSGDGNGDGIPSEDGEPGGGAGGGVDSSENDKVLDGETDYRDVYDQYYDDAMQNLSGDEDSSDGDKKIYESYFDILK